MTDYSRVTLQELLRNDNAGLLCKSYKVFKGTLLDKEYKASPNLKVGGDCLRIRYIYSGTKIIGTNCRLDTWTQAFEDSVEVPEPIFSNGVSVDLDGVDDHINFGDVFQFDNATSFSYSIWVKAQNTAA